MKTRQETFIFSSYTAANVTLLGFVRLFEIIKGILLINLSLMCCFWNIHQRLFSSITKRWWISSSTVELAGYCNSVWKSHHQRSISLGYPLLGYDNNNPTEHASYFETDFMSIKGYICRALGLSLSFMELDKQPGRTTSHLFAVSQQKGDVFRLLILKTAMTTKTRWSEQEVGECT